ACLIYLRDDVARLARLRRTAQPFNAIRNQSQPPPTRRLHVRAGYTQPGTMTADDTPIGIVAAGAELEPAEPPMDHSAADRAEGVVQFSALYSFPLERVRV